MQNQDQLRLDAFVALSGAEFVRQRMLHGLSVGNPSLEAEAYMIKSRVKAADSLVTKVLERLPKKPSYKAEDVRDVIGLRLLTLFRNELPILVRRFLNFVEWSQKDPFFLFHGNMISDCIEEIIIYPTSVNSDPYVGLCIAEFASFGFFTKDDPRYCGGVPVFIDTKDSRYSSIHVVLFANGANVNVGEKVPVEVQLRTSIEDVWGEIDHRLRYKLRQKEKEVIIDNEKTKENHFIEREVSAYLKTLKISLDASSEIADTIETSIKSLDFEKRSIQTSKSNISVGIRDIKKLNIKSSYSDLLDNIVSKLENAYSGIQSLPNQPSIDVITALMNKFDDAQNAIQKLLHDSGFLSHLEKPNVLDAKYTLIMERALLFYWMASLVRSLHGNYKGQYSGVKATEHLRTAFSLYHEVAQLKLYSNDPILAFRVATVLDLKGDYELARSKYREATLLLETENNLGSGSYFRTRIPLQYGISLWQNAEELKRRASEFGGIELVNIQRQNFYKEAILITLPLLDFDPSKEEVDDWPVSWADQHSNVQNNILDFSLCYMNAGGADSDLAELGLHRKALQKLLMELVPNGVQAISIVSFADTVRAAARLLGDVDLNDSAAHRVLELIDGKDFALSLPDIAYQEMQIDALNDIKYNQDQKQ